MRCEICGKTAGFGKNVAHDRLYVNGRTNRKIKPNLHRVHIETEAGRRQAVVCTRCMRTMKKNG